MAIIVLIVEEKPMLGQGLMEVVLFEGYTAHKVGNFDAALRFLRNTHCDLVLASISTTQATEDFITAIRSDETVSHVAVILYRFAKYQKLLTVQPDHFLPDIFTPQQVIDAMEEVLA